MDIPKVFLSYSHDTLEHKKWVLELATRLRTNGIDAILDQWELGAGSDIPHYMEQNLANADYIVMVCTRNYVEKANMGTGGVGYEKMIITATLMRSINETKVIPIVRQSGEKMVPTFLTSKMYIDFSKQDEFELAYDNLIRAIHKSPLFIKPPVGNNPFERIDAKPPEVKHDPIKNIMAYFAIEYEKENEHLYFDDILSKFQISRLMLQHILTEMQNLNLIYYHTSSRSANYYKLTQLGIKYIVDKGIIK
ncbi:toll/interleukin-1 receptor domain-containing protein [Ferruginibacter paludis]|uniref:toll/interleukin-1 receptor domain-containing protein n=1 Tax=Ferruginibacter paludis TaxID=1310417 RepID=UPI0025B30603|nr:toll/interleukin-1 receptor domain-containing protein [Ferruginibacter paludis]MDN3654509.1 toll/interleukin-1 receptor domain-containing protein [Ferruginibacter paludis]